MVLIVTVAEWVSGGGGVTLPNSLFLQMSLRPISVDSEDFKKPDSAFAVRPDGSFWMFESAEPDSAPVRMSCMFLVCLIDVMIEAWWLTKKTSIEH